MSAPHPAEHEREPADAASRIVLVYLTFGLAFIGITEFALRHADATVGWRVASRLVFLAVSAVLLSLVIGRELRLRHRAERHGVALLDETRVATERLAALVGQSPVGILEIEPSGAIASANAAAEEILGGEGGGAGALVLHEDLHATLEEVRLRLDAGEVIVGSELVTKRTDGSPVELSLSASLLSPAPGSIGPGNLLVVAADVTERRRLREQLEQGHRLEALGHMAGAVAHDYNNLLTVIIGYTDMVKRRLGPDHPFISDLDAVLSAGEQARVLTDHLLTVSRRRVVAPEVIDVAELTDGLGALLPRLVGRSVDVVVEHLPGTGRVLADKGQLESALLNLAVNARDAMPGGGRLSIVTGPGGLPSGPASAISVSDEGSGMDAATRARCFEPFFTTKHRADGTGLGLATVHAAVTQAGGTVLVESAPGKGATFTILLPVTDAPLVEQPVSEPAAGGTETILLVDDEPAIRAYGRDVLRAGGYEVTVAADGHDAERQVLDGLEFDLLLTDVVMPGRSGVALAQRMVELRPDVPVLFVSGFAEDPVLHRAGHRAPFLPKPFSPEALLGAVRDALDGARQGSNR